MDDIEQFEAFAGWVQSPEGARELDAYALGADWVEDFDADAARILEGFARMVGE